jgi:hypothetical protein
MRKSREKKDEGISRVLATLDDNEHKFHDWKNSTKGVPIKKEIWHYRNQNGPMEKESN